MNSKTKNALIGGLLAIVFVMAVGYAAFSTQLTINGNSAITSTWDVHMTGISATGHTGTGSDVPFVEGTTADGTKLVDGTTVQFKADLKSPGDSVTYTVTVVNGGSLDAKVTAIDFTEGPNNAAIDYDYNGIAIGDTLDHGDTTTFTVIVKYLDSVTQQPENTQLSNTLTMRVTYEQNKGTSSGAGTEQP